MKYILYYAIHQKRFVYDTLYSIMAILYTNKSNSDFRFIIYTDHASDFYEIFSKYNFDFTNQITIEEIDKSIVEYWFNNEYVYKIKIEILNDFLTKYNESVLYIDSDMYALRNIMPLYEIIYNKQFIMYDNLGNLMMIAKDMIINHSLVSEFLLKNKHLVKSDQLHLINGAIGINITYKDTIDRIQILCDQIYNDTKERNSDEIAFSLILPTINKVEFASNFFIHGTGFIKLLIAYLLNTFFDNHKDILTDFLSYYNLDFSLFERINLKYDDIQFFPKIFSSYVSYNKLDFEKHCKPDKDKYISAQARYTNNRYMDLVERFINI